MESTRPVRDIVANVRVAYPAPAFGALDELLLILARAFGCVEANEDLILSDCVADRILTLSFRTDDAATAFAASCTCLIGVHAVTIQEQVQSEGVVNGKVKPASP